jgi:putative lipoic acid-binding regulatory protein
MTEKEAFYIKLVDSLDATTKFPAEYLYKFIVPTNGHQETEVKELFKNKLAKIVSTKSKTGKYISLSIRVKLSSSNEVISYYKKAENVEGIISL